MAKSVVQYALSDGQALIVPSVALRKELADHEQQAKVPAVTMRPELVEEAFAEANKRDMPLTAWVREVSLWMTGSIKGGRLMAHAHGNKRYYQILIDRQLRSSLLQRYAEDLGIRQTS